ncbi:MAG: type VI secretion system baseplate subunit TssK [Myxococcales bacterium]|nr:MAG: type VI secretion system baseplate subunit TssK [Myxococcales bacterium]
MTTTRKPIWTEGLLVSQHHFQQQDQYFEGLLQDRIRAVSHYDWGISELKIDERSFAAGQFRLQRLSAIWPDGASVACGEGMGVPAPEPRDLPPGAQRVEVFVGLASSSDPAQVSLDGSATRRFTRELTTAVDTNSGTSAQEVEWARPNLRILFGNERRDGFVALRVAELLRQENGQYIVVDTRVAPVLKLSAAPFLEAGLRRVLANIVARQQQLFGERKGRQNAGADFHASEIRKFLQLQVLSSVVPELNHLLDTARAHPEEAYLVLVRLAGTLGCFSAEMEPVELPKFNYLELGETFEALFAIILRLVSGGTERAYTEIALEHRPDGMFIGRIAEPRLTSMNFFIAVKANMAEALVRERAPGVLKLAGWSHIYDVVKHARTGVKVAVEWSPSGALPLRPGLCFFRVEREGSYWEEIVRSSTVALYLPSDGDWAGAEVALYAADSAALR